MLKGRKINFDQAEQLYVESTTILVLDLHDHPVMLSSWKDFQDKKSKTIRKSGTRRQCFL